MSVKVKICGLCRPEDARAAAQAGADALGLNFVRESPRYLPSWERARAVLAAAQPFAGLVVGLFVNPKLDEILTAARELPLGAIQLHGEEPAEFGRELRRHLALPIWKAYRIAAREDLALIERDAWPCDALVLDARVAGGPRGGTGRAFDWGILAGFTPKPILVLAGGVTAKNAGEAVRRARPAWLDTASGVESSPGVKDEAKMRAFVKAARQA
jgi:phosphoribosylanthranilate isomerase